MQLERIIFIVGPTAIGKTRIAVKLARALGSEIISADSMQVYKGMRILSQAPGRCEKGPVRHHLTEMLDPRKEYSVALFIKKAHLLIASIIKKGKVPIIVGGSGLYVKGLIDGLFPSPQADMEFRKKMARSAQKYGSKKLHVKLTKIDPGSAALIHPNDLRRIIRALEIHHSTGKTMTELKSKTKGLKDIYDIKIFGLMRPRGEVYAGIDARVDKMFRDNVVGEVKRLKAKRLSKTAGEALGLKEISGYLAGSYDLDAAKEMMKMNTRRFAKRQFTWFLADPRIKWLDMSKMGEGRIIREMIKDYKGKEA